MTHLLDTNVCIALMRGHSGVRERMKDYSPNDLAISTVTLFELLAGARRCRNPPREEARIAAMIAPIHLVPFDADAASKSAEIRYDLALQGKPIGPYDLQIAGQALAIDCILVTHNTAEFQRVAGLRLENWEESTDP